MKLNQGIYPLSQILSTSKVRKQSKYPVFPYFELF